MKAKVGQYFYIPRGKGFRIYQYETVSSNGGSSAIPAIDEPLFFDREKARKRVYELNGWKYNRK